MNQMAAISECRLGGGVSRQQMPNANAPSVSVAGAGLEPPAMIPHAVGGFGRPFPPLIKGALWSSSLAALILYRDEKCMNGECRAHRAHLGNIVLTIIIVPSRFEFWKLRFSTFLPAHLSSSLALTSLSERSVGF